MRRLMLLFCLLAALPALAAVETTTVNGKVILSDGAAATAGTITCTLSTPGTALDGATSQRVAGSDTATIGADGTITGLTLVPNDAITPSGTTYSCTFSVSAPRRASWPETWTVTTSPDPVNVGSITRHNVAPGITVGSFLQYVSAEPSGACTASEAPRYATATDKICECVALAWSCAGLGATPAGSDGDVQVKSGTALAAGTGLSVASSVVTFGGKYIDHKTAGGRIAVREILGDQDGDGSLELASDVLPLLRTLLDQDGDGTHDRIDLDGDGTTDGAAVTLRLSAGRWRYGYRDTFSVYASNVTIEGAGKDSTYLDAVGDCDGTADVTGDGTIDSLDDGDSTADYQALFRVYADDFTLRDLTIDGGSTRWQAAAAGTCNINDVDGDGTGNVSDTTPGGTCSGKWCPADSHYIVIFVSDPGTYRWTEGSTVGNVRFLNVDRNPIYWSYAPSGKRAHVFDCDFHGAGEHFLSNPPPQSVVSGNHFDSAWNPIVLAGTSGTYSDIAITDNTFTTCIGYCIGTEYDPYEIRNVRIAGNTFTCTDATACTNSPIYLVGGDYNADGTNDTIIRNWVIANNAIRYIGPNPAALIGTSKVGSDSNPILEGLTISGNAITYDPAASSAQKAAISIGYAQNVTIADNAISVDGDGTQASDTQYEQCVAVGTGVDNMLIAGNECKLTGTGGMGVYVGTDAPGTLISGNRIVGVSLTTGRGIELQGSDEIQIEGNYLKGFNTGIYAASTGSDQVLRNNITNNMLDLSAVASANCVSFVSATSDNNTITGNVCRNAAGSWCWTDTTSARPNVWSNNVCLGGYVTSSPGSARSNVAASPGMTLAFDEATLGTYDATGRYYLHDPSAIDFDDDADAIRFRAASRLFVGTCGASECLVYDLDADGTIESTDTCWVDGGQDANCDGTAD